MKQGKDIGRRKICISNKCRKEKEEKIYIKRGRLTNSTGNFGEKNRRERKKLVKGIKC